MMLKTNLDKTYTVAEKIARRSDEKITFSDDLIAVETPISFTYNNKNFTVMMATPKNFADFAFGFSISEDIISNYNEILNFTYSKKKDGYNLSIVIPDHKNKLLRLRKRTIEGRTGCGLCGVTEIDQALRPLRKISYSSSIKKSIIWNALNRLPAKQVLNDKTGSVHAAAFANLSGQIIYIREDVGRHNALDKLIGSLVRKNIDPLSGFIIVTSRCSMEMVQKTITFGCPILVSVSAPTSLALDIAEKNNLTVIAFARERKMNIYTKAYRVV